MNEFRIGICKVACPPPPESLNTPSLLNSLTQGSSEQFPRPTVNFVCHALTSLFIMSQLSFS
ncbi:hypothetical protein ACLS0R_19110, partial [Comamonas jiangduensis]|uniref:hypothetical protein n=1 Tax=Comamonas jiangduensis TaxID=1194168 RepID=UPI003BF7E26B